MKAKLLKKLRKRYQIQRRNSQYRLVDISMNPPFGYAWMDSLAEAVVEYRANILYDAISNYKYGKEIITKWTK